MAGREVARVVNRCNEAKENESKILGKIINLVVKYQSLFLLFREKNILKKTEITIQRCVHIYIQCLIQSIKIRPCTISYFYWQIYHNVR